MTKISAPAKIILLGEHVVVYGQPAIAVPILSLRAYAEVRATSGGSGLNIIAKDLNRVLPVDLNTEVSNEALEIALRLILEYLHISPPNIDIIIQSDIPIASGLGSGAAISTVIARAISSAVGYKFEPDELNDLVFQVRKFIMVLQVALTILLLFTSSRFISCADRESICCKSRGSSLFWWLIPVSQR